MKKTLCAFAVGSLLVSANSFAGDMDMKKFKVTITNITTNHVLTPAAVIAHAPRYHLFQLAKPASPELAMLAESGGPMPLLEKAKMTTGVYAVAAGSAAIPPGKSLSIEITAPLVSRFTIATMLAGTNDAFVSARTDRQVWGTLSPETETYDAGSELNNEECMYIPGPPCHLDGLNERTPDMGEGYVTVHKGMFGPSVLPMSNIPSHRMDWRGENALVTIKAID